MLELVSPGQDQPPARLDFKHLAAVGNGSTGKHERPRRSRLPFGDLPGARPELAGELRLDQRLPQLIGRGPDVGDIDKTRLSHRSSPPNLALALRAPRGACARTCRSSARRSRGSAPG